MKGRGESGWGTDALGAVYSKTQDLMDTVAWGAEMRAGGGRAQNWERGGLG